MTGAAKVMEVCFPSCSNADVAQSVERILGKDKVTSSILVISSIFFGGVAQLARACGSYPQCPGFESLRRHHIFAAESGLGPDFLLSLPDLLQSFCLHRSRRLPAASGRSRQILLFWVPSSLCPQNRGLF